MSNSIYNWLVFAHILGIFGFLLAHGSAAAVSFRLRKERSVERIRTLLDLSQSVAVVGRISLLVVLVAGIALGFIGSWWRYGWIWAALGVFVIMSVSMSPLAQRSFNQLRQLTQAHGAKSSGSDALKTGGALVEKQLDVIVAGLHPVALTVVGFGGLTIILWLMMFKPF